MKTNVIYSLLVCSTLLFSGMSVSGKTTTYNYQGYESGNRDSNNNRQLRLQLLTDYLRYHQDISVKEYSKLVNLSSKEGLKDLQQFVSDKSSGIVKTKKGNRYTLSSRDGGQQGNQPGVGNGNNNSGRPNGDGGKQPDNNNGSQPGNNGGSQPGNNNNNNQSGGNNGYQPGGGRNSNPNSTIPGSNSGNNHR